MRYHKVDVDVILVKFHICWYTITSCINCISLFSGVIFTALPLIPPEEAAAKAYITELSTLSGNILLYPSIYNYDSQRLYHKDTFFLFFSVPQNNFDTFNCSPFHHIVQEVDEIWYPGRAIIRLLRSKFHWLPVQNGRMTSI